MADQKLSELTLATLGSGDDLVYLVRSSADYRATLASMMGLVGHVADQSTTTGTSEEVIASVSLPASALAETSGYVGLEMISSVSHAANTNTATVRMRVGGLAGLQLTARDDATSGNNIVSTAHIWKAFGDASVDWKGAARVDRATGVVTAYPCGLATGGLTYANALACVVTAETPTQAGDLTLMNFVVRLIPG